MGCVSTKAAAPKAADGALRVNIPDQVHNDIASPTNVNNDDTAADSARRGSDSSQKRDSCSDILYKGYSASNPKKVPAVPMSPDSSRRRHAVVYEMFDLLDVDSDGIINILEFHEWVKPAKGKTYSQAEKVVQRDKNAFLLFQIDTDHNGEINHDELEQFCNRFTVREVEALVRDIRARQDKQKVLRSPKRSPRPKKFISEMGASGYAGKVYNGDSKTATATASTTGTEPMAFSLGSSVSSTVAAAVQVSQQQQQEQLCDSKQGSKGDSVSPESVTVNVEQKK